MILSQSEIDEEVKAIEQVYEASDSGIIPQSSPKSVPRIVAFPLLSTIIMLISSGLTSAYQYPDHPYQEIIRDNADVWRNTFAAIIVFGSLAFILKFGNAIASPFCAVYRKAKEFKPSWAAGGKSTKCSHCVRKRKVTDRKNANKIMYGSLFGSVKAFKAFIAKNLTSFRELPQRFRSVDALIDVPMCIQCSLEERTNNTNREAPVIRSKNRFYKAGSSDELEKDQMVELDRSATRIRGNSSLEFAFPLNTPRAVMDFMAAFMCGKSMEQRDTSKENTLKRYPCSDGSKCGGEGRALIMPTDDDYPDDYDHEKWGRFSGPCLKCSNAYMESLVEACTMTDLDNVYSTPAKLYDPNSSHPERNQSWGVWNEDEYDNPHLSYIESGVSGDKFEVRSQLVSICIARRRAADSVQYEKKRTSSLASADQDDSEVDDLTTTQSAASDQLFDKVISKFNIGDEGNMTCFSVNKCSAVVVEDGTERPKAKPMEAHLVFNIDGIWFKISTNGSEMSLRDGVRNCFSDKNGGTLGTNSGVVTYDGGTTIEEAKQFEKRLNGKPGCFTLPLSRPTSKASAWKLERESQNKVNGQNGKPAITTFVLSDSWVKGSSEGLKHSVTCVTLFFNMLGPALDTNNTDIYLCTNATRSFEGRLKSKFQRARIITMWKRNNKRAKKKEAKDKRRESRKASNNDENEGDKKPAAKKRPAKVSLDNDEGGQMTKRGPLTSWFSKKGNKGM